MVLISCLVGASIEHLICEVTHIAPCTRLWGGEGRRGEGRGEGEGRGGEGRGGEAMGGEEEGKGRGGDGRRGGEKQSM